AEILGAETMFLGMDERIVDDTPTRNAIINAIRWANPDVIFTHWPYDSSVDHHIIGQIVFESLLCLNWRNQLTEYTSISKLLKVLFCDQDEAYNYQPEQYEDITAQMEKKKQMLACQKSQVELEQDYMRVTVVLGAFRGLQSVYVYAEGFKAHMSFENPPDYKMLP